MKKIIKLIINKFAEFFIFLLYKNNFGRYIIDQLSKNILLKNKKIKHKDIELKFFIPNRLNNYRVNTFSFKEPETLDWIDGFKKNCIFWDIGANIGLYSCYAAKKKESKVYAFEPSVFNLELLAKNIHLNSLSKNITIFPLPLTDNLKEKSFEMSSTDWGGALSTFGENFSHDGKPSNNIFNYKNIGLSVDDCINLLKFEKPNYIKIDVDGIEHLILKGALNTLNNVESVLVEVNDNFKEQINDVSKYLTESGFKLEQKKFNESYNIDSPFNKHNNQIWKK